MQVATPEIVVTVIRTGKHPLTRVSYGPYMTTCSPNDVWFVKKQIKTLPVVCQTCKRKI